MRNRGVLTGIIVATVLIGCGPTDKYRKSQSGADSTSSEGVISLNLGEASADWAHGLAGAWHGARLRYDTGDTAGAVATLDSLIVIAKVGLDTIPYEDDRRKVLLLLVTDLYTQAVTWDEMRGDQQGAEARTRDFAALAEHLQRQKDSIQSDTIR